MTRRFRRSVDGSRPRLFNVDRDRIDLAPSRLGAGDHTLILGVKDVDERVNRWTRPLLSGIGLKGFEPAAGGQELGVSPSLEFLGDYNPGVRAVGPYYAGSPIDSG